MPMTVFVLDTSVLLSDPGAVARFDEHDVVLPIVVVSELEAKRDHPELGWFARQALRLLDDLRIVHGRLDEPIPVGDGTLRVELNHVDASVLPPAVRGPDGDSRILAVAANLAAYARTTQAVLEAVEEGAAGVDDLLARVCLRLDVTMRDAGAVVLNRAVVSAHLTELLGAGAVEWAVEAGRLTFRPR